MKRASLGIAILLSPYSKAIAFPLNHDEQENFPDRTVPYLIVGELSDTVIPLYNGIVFLNKPSVMEIQEEYRGLSGKEVEELRENKYPNNSPHMWVPVTEEVIHRLFQIKK